ncbi:MAG: dienelactone hydrolase family protein [Chloroflexi bacterium]|nr:dienelactone hydrolase family protein [Chloroflexota bacterium]OJV90234.1 MAG: hydrolase [Chloroflexi bacterium 54-19]
MGRLSSKPAESRLVKVPASQVTLNAILTVPEKARGIVIFVHGSGSSRLSPRNQFVARSLNQAGLATLLFDLLTPAEELNEQGGQFRFNIALLAGRLLEVTRWVAENPGTSHLKVAYFGASTGAAAALFVAARQPESVKAIVSRGGRPDLAGSTLPLVKAPTLLIVGGNDPEVIRLNEKALDLLSCKKKLEIVRGATHLFEEPGTLEQVASLAQNWFEQNL